MSKVGRLCKGYLWKFEFLHFCGYFFAITCGTTCSAKTSFYLSFVTGGSSCKNLHILLRWIHFVQFVTPFYSNPFILHYDSFDPFWSFLFSFLLHFDPIHFDSFWSTRSRIRYYPFIRYCISSAASTKLSPTDMGEESFIALLRYVVLKSNFAISFPIIVK